MAMSNDEYLEHGGNLCPFCKSENIEGSGQIQSDNNSAWQEIVCNDCDCTWDDIYTLTGYESK